MRRARHAGRQRRSMGFNLAFLDIMACGLGAIILVFMLVKYNHQPNSEQQELHSELASIRDEIKTIESENSAHSVQIKSLQQKLQLEIKHAAQSDKESAATVKELIALTKKISALEKKLAAKLDKQLAQKGQSTAAQDKTNEGHLIGLRVPDRSNARILILLDSSASMADELLVDIIKIKVADIATKRNAPKWQRALRVVNWIVDRIPLGGEYMVVQYNEAADFVPNKQWQGGGDAGARVRVSEELGKLYPHGATNLYAVVDRIKKIPDEPTDIYIITDSLPTKGRGGIKALSVVNNCFSSTKTTVSGKCRKALFYDAVKHFSTNSAMANTVVNTVLLPIEGDPDAAHAYWLWAASTSGTMISPVASWP